MLAYIIRRILLVIPTMVGIIFIIFVIMELTPGDPALIMLGNKATPEAVQQIHEELNLDAPFFVRFFDYLVDLVKHGDMGTSYTTSRPVTQELMTRLPTTIKLATFSIIIAVVIGVPLGVISAVKQYSIFDIFGVATATILASVPPFWFGLMAILLFSLKFGLLPSNGTDSFVHYILPSVTLGATTLASLLRMTRATMLETLREDYINTVRAKGQTERAVVFAHGLKNAVLPVVTVTGMEFGWLLGGALVIEQIFSINGLGTLMIDAIRSQDLPVVMGSCIVLAFFFVLVMLLVDIIYALIDPRVRSRYVKGARV